MILLLIILALAFPRIALLILFFTTTYLQSAYHSALVVAFGFLFLPLTTIVYAWMVNSHLPLQGIYLLGLVLAGLIDLGLMSQGGYRRRRVA